ncbi:PKD domain-containing protein [Brumimicrobium aurantiacum]|uniref:T9SS C-terminal target domain-containing protein n=1 Tax=Brumimicrobium aurantiacum TaxID=1737063 RepID=A0A3E1F1Q1_9FLAO|nr:PKD domain-containing protein [Brumimicrobium aurantiacum]RFC55748.1 T9SS C-terminal target domain-containing protein [Brumimicrobium aurantiacum]
MVNLKPTLISFLLCLTSILSFAQGLLVYPKDSAVFDVTEIQFEWNSKNGANNYHLQIADEPTFTNLIVNNSNLTSLSYLAQNLTPNTVYYWRVKPNNSNWSNAHIFTLVDFRTWPELEFMLDPDSVILDVNGKVEQWTDLSGNGLNFNQSNLSSRPSKSIDQQINNKNTIQFNPNSNEYLIGPDLSHLLEGEIISLVKKFNFPITNQFHSAIWRFNTSLDIGVYPYTNNYVYSGFGRSIRFTNLFLTDSLEMCTSHILNISSGINFNFNINNSTKFSSSNGSVIFTNEALLGRGRNGANYYFDGSFGQILFFNTVLTDSLRNLVHAQMQHKYAPPVNLGRNISQYGFCDTTLYAGERFTSYLWSDGSTADSLIANGPGTYWVEVEDIFGFVSRDTIEVLPELNYPTTQLYCPNDSIIWDTGLGQHYSYLWSDGSTGDTLEIETPGDYHVVVTDTNGCIFKSDTLTFAEDPYPASVSLGPDTNLCSGNTIELLNGANGAVSYLWNTNDVTPSIAINTTGTYSVIVENSNGCIAKDTIDVTILGDAPIVQMQIPAEVCLGDTFNFQDQSTTTDGSTIIDWEWAFANNDTLTIATGTQVYDTSGFFPVHLTIETSAGCFNNITDTIEVRSLPILTFATSNQCEDESILFNGGQMTPSLINTWEWNFDDPSSGSNNMASGQNTDHIFNAPGDYDVMLVGTDVFGCIDTLTQTKTIAPKPVADFTFTEVCEGSVVDFQNTSTVAAPASLNSQFWSFGDGTNATQTDPQKPYSTHGSYTVTLSSTADNGCSHSVSKDIKIHAIPQVANTISQNCAGLATEFSDASFVPDGSVAIVDWDFNNQNAQSGFSITQSFPTDGTYTLEQTVTSGFGCLNTEVSTITINPFLAADFTFTPNAFIADYPILFENTSTGENTLIWDFGNGIYSTQNDTSIVFDNTQIGTTQSVKLKVENQWNCTDSMIIQLPVLKQRTDLELGQLFVQETNGFLTIGVQLKNSGSTPISEVDLILSSPNEGLIKETWTGMLLAEEEEIFVFNASPSAVISKNDSLQNYICIKGEIINPSQFTEQETANNEVCKSLTEDNAVVVQPYPNPVHDLLTIKIVMPKEGNASIRILDNLGRIIQEVSKEEAMEKGLNTTTVNTDNFSNGNYKIYVSTDIEGKETVVIREFVKM